MTTETALPENAVGYKKGIRKWIPVVILSLALMIIVIDTTVLNVSLKTITQDLGTDLKGIQWVITAYALTLAALTITGGRIGDLFGRKRIFMIGAAIFAVGSFITSISHSVGMMVIGESIIEGIGAAMMMPATASLLVANYRGRDRAIAFGVWGGIAAAAAGLGPILGGWLTTNYSWRWAFRINIIVAAILLLGSLLIAESDDTEEKHQLDILGVFLSATGLFLAVFGVIQSAQFGWWMAKQSFEVFGHSINAFGLSVTPLAIIAGLLLLAIFGWSQIRREKHGLTPLVSMKLFRNTQFTAGATVTTILSLGQIGLIFAVPVFLQSVQNLDALHTGLALLPMSAALLVAAPFSAFISKWILPKRIVQVGLGLNVFAALVLRQSINVNATAASLVPGLLMFGIGMGLVMAQVSNLTLSAVSVDEAGEASGVNNTFRQIGSSFGSAIIGATLLTTLASGLASGINNSAVIPSQLKPQLSQTISAQASSVEFGGASKAEGKEKSSLSEEVQHELTTIAHQASANGSKKAITFTGLFTLLAFIAAAKLPSTRKIERNESVAAGH